MEPVSLALPRDLAAVREARAFVLARCSRAGLAPRTCTLAVLLTSEVVTNAMLHGRTGAHLTVTTAAGRVRVEVRDDSPQHPEVLQVGVSALHGRGMAMVARSSTGWGVVDVPGGKVVWFELAEPAVER